MNRFLAFAACALLLTAGPLPAQSLAALPVVTQSVDTQSVDTLSVDTLEIRGHTRFLADDLLLGRGTGTQGERLAAAYIMSQAERLGLSALPGTDSFLHPVPLLAATIEPWSHLVLHTERDSVRFQHGRDFILNTGGTGAFRDFGGRAVFFGDPAAAAAVVAAQRTLVGRVAVFMGPLGAAAVDIVPALLRAGADGVVLLVPDTGQYDLYVRSRGETRYYVDAEVDDPVWQPPLPVLIAGPGLSAALLAGATVPPALMEGTADAGLDLGRSITARIRVTVAPVAAANVAAMLPGADPERRDEFVVYTAHYDHLGVSTPDAHGDSIYSGFSDNAAGVGMLLAIADALRAEPPPHSTLFLFFTGEERGLLGSSYMAARRPFDLERVLALINLDAGAPPVPPVSWRIAGGDSRLGEIAQDVAAARGWTATASPASPNSDHWPFLRRGVPSIFIIPGDEWQDTTPEERAALRARWDRYHQPGDRWHPDFPFAGLGRYADYALHTGLEAARR
jgi:hypothetical protein